MYACLSDCRFVHVHAMPLRLEKTGSLGARITGRLLNVGAVTWTLVLCKSSTCSLAPVQVSLKVFFYVSPNWASLSWRHCYLSILWILQLCSLVPAALSRNQLIIFLMHVLHWQHSWRSRWHGVRQDQRAWAHNSIYLSKSGLPGILFLPLLYESMITFSVEQTQRWWITQSWIYIFVHQPF